MKGAMDRRGVSVVQHLVWMLLALLALAAALFGPLGNEGRVSVVAALTATRSPTRLPPTPIGPTPTAMPAGGPAFLVRDIEVGTGTSSPDFRAELGGALIFNAYTSGFGQELWRSDGTAAGTFMLKDINPGSSGGLYNPVVKLNGVLLFTAEDANGVALWRSDGTSAGTVMLKDINPGPGGSIYGDLVVANNLLFFAAYDGVHGTELWRSDGTVAGTVMLKDIYPGTEEYEAHPTHLSKIGNRLFFYAHDSVGRALWKSDGTTAGTTMIARIELANPDPGSQLLDMNGTAYFLGTDSEHGDELWRSDGTAAGTFMLKDIYPGFWGSQITGMTNVGGTLYFAATDSVSGSELWKSDGTSAGTVLVKDMYPGAASSQSSYPYFVANPAGGIFFTALSDSGEELWKSDGTSAGTVTVRDIYPGGLSSSPRYLTMLNGTLLFLANDGVSGPELWKSDGTSAGTVLVRDIYAGPHGIAESIYGLYAHQGKVYFRANDGYIGSELWASDGTAAGTQVVQDINRGRASSSPGLFTAVGSNLFFGAIESQTGSELWALPLAPAPVPQPDLTVISVSPPTSSSNPFPCNTVVEWGTSVRVKNIGTAAAGSFEVDLNGRRQTVGGLGAGQETYVFFMGANYQGLTTATVDATALVAESREDNNQLSITSYKPNPTSIPRCTYTPTGTPPTATRTPTRTATRTGTPPTRTMTVMHTRTPTRTATSTRTTPTNTPTQPVGNLPDLIVRSVAIGSQNPCNWSRLDTRVVVENVGAASAGSFVVQVTFGANPPASQTVAGLAAGQSVALWFIGYDPNNTVVVVDATSAVSESNETNNRWSAPLPVPGAPVPCTPTPTQPVSGTCAPVTATIAAPFAYDGAGTFCWQATTIPSYINSWNLTSLKINGVDFTNRYAASSQLPPKINGAWYISYSSSVAWGHFEAR